MFEVFSKNIGTLTVKQFILFLIIFFVIMLLILHAIAKYAYGTEEVTA